MISVIIPTFNSAKYVSEALMSVFRQIYPDYEIIVVDDGSTDNTRDVISKYLDQITYIKQPNCGPAVARNVGIRRAKGEYIAFLDADDLWLPNKLSEQLKCLECNPGAAFVYCKMQQFSGPNGECLVYSDTVKPSAVKSGRIFDDILKHSFILLSSVLIRTEVVKEMGGFDQSLFTAEDTNLWLKVAWKYEIVGMSSVLVKRRKHSNNLSDNTNIPIGTLDNLEKIVSLIPEVSPDKYRPMKDAYRLRGADVVINLYYVGDYEQSLSICNRLIGMSAFDTKIIAYWILLHLPSSIINLLRYIF